MNKSMRILGASLILSLAFWGCQSRQEAAGDAYLKAGDAGNALAQYEEALRKGSVSNSFYSNYTKAHALFLRARAAEDPSAQMLDVLKDTLMSLLKQHPDAENEKEASLALAEVASKRLQSGSPQGEDGGFQFFKDAVSLPGKAPEVMPQFAAAKKSFIDAKLAEAQAKLDEASSDATAGIVADYELNRVLLLTGEETPEMQALWSKVRQKNLTTYLYYSATGLIEGGVDARINKYGLLMAIVKYEFKPPTVLVGATVWNVTSGPAEIDGSNFRLVDRQGNSYEPATTLQAFKKKTVVEIGKTSDVGGLTFKLPADAQPAYLELKVADGREGRKYLP